MSGTSCPPAAVDDRRAASRSAALCTKLSATRSTPSERPNRRSSASLGVSAEAGSATPGALMPLCCAERRAVDYGGVDRGSRRVDRHATRRGRRPAADPDHGARRAPVRAYVVDTRPGPPSKSPVVDHQRVADGQRDGRAPGQPSGSNLRTTQILEDGHGPSRPLRGLAHACVAGRVRVVRAVREIQPHDVHPAPA